MWGGVAGLGWAGVRQEASRLQARQKTHLDQLVAVGLEVLLHGLVCKSGCTHRLTMCMNRTINRPTGDRPWESAGILEEDEEDAAADAAFLLSAMAGSLFWLGFAVCWQGDENGMCVWSVWFRCVSNQGCFDRVADLD